MRIITRLTVSGPSTHVTLVNRGLDRLGWETLLVHGSIEADESEMDLSSIEVARTRVPSMRRQIRPLEDARALVELVATMRRFKPDIVHTHQSKAGMLGRIAATLAGVPIRVHTFHGTVFDGYFGPRLTTAIVWAERALARTTKRLVVLSEAQRHELQQLGIARNSQVAVVPLGMDTSRFEGRDRVEARHAFGIPADEVVILAVGRFAQIKRLDRLLRIYADVHARCANTGLYLIGDGPLRTDLARQATELGIHDAVNFIGWTNAMPAWYAAADLVVNTSDSEGTPLALIEAGVSGRPVVATNVGGVADVVRDGTNGFIVDRDDEAGFAERIVRLIDNAELRLTMGAAASTENHRFSGDRLVADLDRLYTDLLGGRR